MREFRIFKKVDIFVLVIAKLMLEMSCLEYVIFVMKRTNANYLFIYS